jgi:hypothetical protein
MSGEKVEYTRGLSLDENVILDQQRQIEALTREVEALRAERDEARTAYLSAAEAAHILSFKLEAAEARALAAEQRLVFLERRAHQNTAYDVFGNGGNWHVAVHSDDNHLSFIAAIDAAISAKRGEGEA